MKGYLRILAVVLPAVLLQATASKAEDASEREAQKAYEEGVALHEARREEEAYVKFKVAYAAKRSPVILFALARTEQLTGRHLEAIRHYRQYVRHPESPLIAADERNKA